MGGEFSKYLAEYIYQHAWEICVRARRTLRDLRTRRRILGRGERDIADGSAVPAESTSLKIRVVINSRVTSTTRIDDVFSCPSSSSSLFLSRTFISSL